MADYTELLQVMKRAAVEAVAAAQPVALCYGTVRSVEPLQIMADQKLPLEAEQLELLSAVRGGLQVGEKVLLLRWPGRTEVFGFWIGFPRLEPAQTKGEW